MAVLSDVRDADGTRSSDRSMPGDALASPDGGAPARDLIASQDLEITGTSGLHPRAIASVAGAAENAPAPRGARSR